MKNNEQYFRDMLYYWMGRFGLDEHMNITQDNRYDCYAVVEVYDKDGHYEVKYNTKYIRKLPKYILLSSVLHEIGHLVNQLPYDTYFQQIKSEYLAERFALDIMKEEYPKMYKLNNKRMKKNLKKEKYFVKNFDDIHMQAFMNIEEYL